MQKSLSTATAPRLYAITDSTLMPYARFNYKAQQALEAGLKWIQYRDKSSCQRKRINQAEALLSLCKQYNAKLIINDDIALAAKIQAHGVHLGQTDGDIATARQQLGKQAIIGSTCHDQLALALQAKEQGASYIAFGRFFASRTKPHAKPAPLSLLRKAKSLALPIVVIGGIDTHNANTLLQAGADTIAVCHDVFGQRNIQQQVSRFHSLDAQQ